MTAASGYRHEALFYSGLEDFAEATVPFVREGLEAGEAVLVAVPGERLEPIRHALGDAADAVRFVDMAVLGRNPARIIPVWQQFADDNRGRRLRGVGEPVWHGRTPGELTECQHHEHLLNSALSPDTPLWLRCPYDTGTLDPAVIEEARRSHPVVCERDGRYASDLYEPREPAVLALEAPMSAAPPGAAEMTFGAQDLTALRTLVAGRAAAARIGADRAADVVVAVNELATNSIRHGGGSGRLAIWQDGKAIVCEVRDAGHITDPMLGRRRPDDAQLGGRGLWIVNQLCDLVKVRSSAGGTAIRVRVLRAVAEAA